VNTIDTQSSTCFSCVCKWAIVPHIRNQFEGHSFNWYKDALMLAFKKCQNM